MQKLVQLLGQTAQFALTREHWANSIMLIGIAIAMIIIGPELDRILEIDGALSAITIFASTYLIFVVFPIAWYRAIGTTGHVSIEYKPSRRTLHYLEAFFRVAALLFLFVAVIVVILAITGSELPKRTDFPFLRLGAWLLSLAFVYVVEVRFGFLFPAAANDKPMTLGDALDASSSIQWALLGTIVIIQLIGSLAGYALNELHDTLSTPLTYLIDVADVMLLFLVQGFTVAATGIAYKQVQ